jgi:hypothetical protein
MTKNAIVLSILAAILAGLYISFFTDLFRRKTIHIIPTIRPARAASQPRDPDAQPVYPVSFSLDDQYKLTCVKVYCAEEVATNKYAKPLWHLVAESNSIPTKAIVYGMPVKGMKPAVPRARPEPLQPHLKYVLMLEAGDVKAQTNFCTREVVPAGGQ